jgi:DNA modification methylase
MSLYLDDGDVRVHAGDCIEVMAELAAESIDAVVCDPPYGLGFMGREWDTPGVAARSTTTGAQNGATPYGRSRAEFGGASYGTSHGAAMAEFQAWCTEWATQAIRVLKPGGHLIAFGGTRTFHRLTCGLEDAGFEIRDVLSWLYGSGFPKSLDVSKAIDKAAGAERQDVYDARTPVTTNTAYGKGLGVNVIERRPVTEAAQTWEGWGTALKPGWEPAVLARKPLTGTVASNVQAHGTGALNIDGCRIGMSEADRHAASRLQPENNAGGNVYGFAHGTGRSGERFEPATAGRWPANVVLDEDAAQQLDAQAGEASYNPSGVFGSDRKGGREYGKSQGHEWGHGPREVFGYGDRGGPSRFFYTAKASTSERNNGHGPQNTHPTVKPVDLMRWLVRLITPPGGVVLDPFAGSGTTGVAARAEGVQCVLIEREAEYLQIIAGRLAQQSLLGGAA